MSLRRDSEPTTSSPSETTTDGRDPAVVRAEQAAEGNVLHDSYLVLSEAERACGFVRPVRESYVHVGPAGPTNPTRELTPEETARYSDYGYVLFEVYPPERHPTTGRFWTRAQLDAVAKGACGTTTRMSRAIAETYARQPAYYGSTYCVACACHRRVGAGGEFVWSGMRPGDPGSRVGT